MSRPRQTEYRIRQLPDGRWECCEARMKWTSFCIHSEPGKALAAAMTAFAAYQAFCADVDAHVDGKCLPGCCYCARKAERETT